MFINNTWPPPQPSASVFCQLCLIWVRHKTTFDQCKHLKIEVLHFQENRIALFHSTRNKALSDINHCWKTFSLNERCLSLYMLSSCSDAKCSEARISEFLNICQAAVQTPAEWTKQQGSGCCVLEIKIAWVHSSKGPPTSTNIRALFIFLACKLLLLYSFHKQLVKENVWKRGGLPVFIKDKINSSNSSMCVCVGFYVCVWFTSCFLFVIVVLNRILATWQLLFLLNIAPVSHCIKATLTNCA